MTDAAARPDLATIAARHVRQDPENDSRCHADLQDWPCDAAALLSEIERLSRVREWVVSRGSTEWSAGWPEDFRRGYDTAVEEAAALTEGSR